MKRTASLNPLRVCLPLLTVLALGGCAGQKVELVTCGSETDCYAALATEIEYPQLQQCCDLGGEWASSAPVTLASASDPEYWDIGLEEVVRITLNRSKVLRDLGGAVVQSPDTAETYWDVAAQETDPRFGVEAALSAFDAQFTGSIFGEKNDRALNNEFFGGGTRLLQQDALVIQSQLSKRAVTGSEFSFRHNIEYDANNAPSNLFPSAWNVNLETEFRHPLLQGSGLQFNRIAGPTRIPGIYNGVLIARINTDVELADFEIAVRNLVSNIENAYWDLYFSYRDLDAKVAARDSSLDTWRRIHALYEAGRRGGEAEKEAQAREQFYRFQEEVQNALGGRLIDGTRTGNGSSGGTFRGGGGVLVAERRLRMLMGLPATDGRLLRPQDEPITAPVEFDWHEITRETVVRRAELRRQRFQVRRLELEWIASKNHLMPRLDTVGRYRWRGFGDRLLDPSGNNPPFDNAYEDLTGGNFQERQLGVELSVPIGLRRAYVATRNAELQLCRARAILREQEHLVLHDVAATVSEMQRAYVVSQTAYNRLEAARQQLDAVQAAFDADKAPLDLLLDAQRRLADAHTRYFRALAEHAVAVKNVHFSKGTLLDYDGVYLSEGGWPMKAYEDAAERESLRGKPRPMNYSSARAPRVAGGPIDQQACELSPPMKLPVELPELEKLPEVAPPLMESLEPVEVGATEPTGNEVDAEDAPAEAIPSPIELAAFTTEEPRRRISWNDMAGSDSDSQPPAEEKTAAPSN